MDGQIIPMLEKQGRARPSEEQSEGGGNRRPKTLTDEREKLAADERRLAAQVYNRRRRRRRATFSVSSVNVATLDCGDAEVSLSTSRAGLIERVPPVRQSAAAAEVSARKFECGDTLLITGVVKNVTTTMEKREEEFLVSQLFTLFCNSEKKNPFFLLNLRKEEKRVGDGRKCLAEKNTEIRSSSSFFSSTETSC
jgi:hypothetical protein